MSKCRVTEDLNNEQIHQERSLFNPEDLPGYGDDEYRLPITDEDFQKFSDSIDDMFKKDAE